MTGCVKLKGYGLVDADLARLLRESGELVIGGRLYRAADLDKADMYGPPLKPAKKARR